ncbi:WD40 repeat protein [Actinoalloteichus hoggarensis]|uniref:WD domain, G-beta repeat n=1 Tax=Actinoalloteichus hoggarensis TaxID=1470176 RepID=A0A221VZL2_9PSEU|nr:AAA family ATPase [Actinoalloteichus hoggarensis]ASO18959.1 WD domain, G-beta repeat [Actinoalloteichus hoggarensis]MBB5920195.1 WD40 repeat protein [Actinoalloteichus hoggarensis]
MQGEGDSNEDSAIDPTGDPAERPATETPDDEPAAPEQAPHDSGRDEPRPRVGESSSSGPNEPRPADDAETDAGAAPSDAGDPVADLTLRRRAERGVRSWIRGAGRGLRKATPYGIIAFLAASAVAPIAAPSLETTEEFSAALDQLGNMGSGYLGDVLADTADRMRDRGGGSDDAEPPSEAAWREAVAEAVAPLLAATDEQGRAIRAEITALLRAVNAVPVALAEATGELHRDLTSAMAAAGGRFDELSWLLTDAQRLLAELVVVQRQQTDLAMRTLFEVTETRRRALAPPRRPAAPGTPRPEPSAGPGADAGGPAGRAGSSAPDAEADEPIDAPTPFPGLTSFGIADAEWFFGREELVTLLLSRLAEQLDGGGPLLVVGDSGAGKSSLLAAGLLPAVADGGLPVEGAGSWPWLRMTPGRTPLAELVGRTAALARVSAARAISDVRAEPSAFGALAVQAAVTAGRPDARLLIVVDQLEELFTLCTDPAERAAFVTALTTAGSALVVAAVRADFLPDCLRIDRLAALLSEGHVSVTAMRRAGLRSAIVEPAARAGIELEPGLTELLLAELVGDHGRPPPAGALPLLAHSLRTTWLRGGGRRMTVADYRAAGGIHGAVAETAERIHQDLDETDRGVLRTTMLSLVALAEGDRPVRRRVPRSAVPDWLLTRLVTARLVTAGDESVEFAHEILLSAWPRLAGWVREDRAGLVIRRRLDDSARYWAESGQDPSGLYRAGRLATAREWAAGRDDLTEEERRFLDASTAAERAERLAEMRVTRRLRGLVTGLAVLLVVAVAAGGLAWRSNLESEAQRRIGQSRQFAAQTMTALDVNPRQSMLFALAALRAAPTVEARGAVLAARRTDYAGRYGADEPQSAWAVAASGETRRIAVGRPDGVLDVYDADSRELVASEWDCHTADILGTAFSADGELLVTGSLEPDGLCVWDMRREVLLRHLPGYGVVDVRLDGGAIAATGGAAGDRLTVWEPRSGEVLAELPISAPPTSIAFSPGGHRLAVGFGDGSALLWEPETGVEPVPLDGHAAPDGAERAGGEMVTVAFARDTGMLATMGPDGLILLRDGMTGEIVDELRESSGTGGPFAFSPDGSMLATGVGSTVRLWSIRSRTWEPVTIQFATAWDVDWLSHTDLIVTTLDRGTFRRNITPRVLSGGDEPLAGGDFSPDGDVLAAADALGAVRFWNPAEGSLVAESAGDGGPAMVAYDPGGGHAVGRSDGTISLHGPDGEEYERWTAEPGVPVAELRFSPDGSRLVAITDDRVESVVTGNAPKLWMWRVGVAAPPRVRELSGMADVQFLRDGTELVVSDDVSNDADRADDPPMRIEVLSAEDLTLRHVVTADEPTVIDIAVSPTAHSVISAHDDGRLREWDLTDGALLRTFATHPVPVRGLAISENAGLIATISPDDRVIRLWDLDSGELFATLSGHQNSINQVLLVEDPTGGTTLAGLGEAGAVSLWRLDVDDAAAELCAALAGPDLAGEWAALDVPEPPCP